MQNGDASTVPKDRDAGHGSAADSSPSGVPRNAIWIAAHEAASVAARAVTAAAAAEEAAMEAETAAREATEAAARAKEAAERAKTAASKAAEAAQLAASTTEDDQARADETVLGADRAEGAARDRFARGAEGRVPKGVTSALVG